MQVSSNSAGRQLGDVKETKKIQQTKSNEDGPNTENVQELPKELPEDERKQQELVSLQIELESINREKILLQHKLSTVGIKTDTESIKECVTRIKANAESKNQKFGLDSLSQKDKDVTTSLFPEEAKNAGDIIKLYNLTQYSEKVMQRISKLEIELKMDSRKEPEP